MLKTVNLPTASAEGNTCRTSIKLLHRALRAMRYQISRGPPRPACSLAASSSFFRLITYKTGLTTIRRIRQEKVRMREERDKLMRRTGIGPMREALRAGMLSRGMEAPPANAGAALDFRQQG